MPPFNASPELGKNDHNNDKPQDEGRRNFFKRAGQIGVAAVAGAGILSGARKLAEKVPKIDDNYKYLTELELQLNKIEESLRFFSSLTQEDYLLVQEVTSKEDVTDSQLIDCLKKTSAYRELSPSTAENIASNKEIFGFFKSHRRGGIHKMDIEDKKRSLLEQHTSVEKRIHTSRESRDFHESRYEVKSTAPTALEISANEEKIRKLQEQITSIEKENERLRQQSAR